MNQYQAIVIGFGKADKTLAATLAKTGWRVAIIEQSNTMYGGTCINIGCIPTKTLVHDAELQHDFAAAMQRKTSVISFPRVRKYSSCISVIMAFSQWLTGLFSSGASNNTSGSAVKK